MTVFGSYSRYYNLLYKDKNYSGEVEYVRGIIQRHSPDARTILDLGCGTGRHDFLLAEIGYEVSGVDMSQEMLEVANNRRSSLIAHRGLADPLAPFFLQGDIRSIRLEKTFDVVISLFHVMSYLTGNQDLSDAFATVQAHLKPGGIFIFDCWYGPAVLADRPVVRIKRLEDDEIELTRIVEPVMLPNQNLVELNYQILARDKKSGAVEEVRETHRMRYLFRQELELLAQKPGMSIVEASEWMTGKEPGLETFGVCFLMKNMTGNEG